MFNIDKLKKKIEWIYNLENESVIIHSDIDGILSMAFLQHHAGLKEIVGLYDLDTFYFKSEEYLKVSNFKKIIGIDLDISFFDIRHIGHHINCLMAGENSLNINEEFGMVDNIIDNYYMKYPLNTIILLYSLFEIEPTTDEEIALIVYADSVFTNYINYKKNVVTWLKRLGQNNILNALENRFDNIMNIINSKIAPITNKFIDQRYSAKGKYSQCPLTKKVFQFGNLIPQYCGNPKDLLDLIRNITNWNVIDLPKSLYYKREYNNIPVSLGDKADINTLNKNIIKITNFLEENKHVVISSCMPYRNSLKVTLSKNDLAIKLVENEFKFVPK